MMSQCLYLSLSGGSALSCRLMARVVPLLYYCQSLVALSGSEAQGDGISLAFGSRGKQPRLLSFAFVLFWLLVFSACARSVHAAS